MSSRTKKSPEIRPGKPDGVRARNRREKTDRIAEAALSLFVSKGIERVTIDEIASAAGIAKGGFYRYFSDRADVVGHLMGPLRTTLDDGAARCREELGQSSSADEISAAYNTLAATLATVLMRYPMRLRLYLQESRAVGEGDAAAVSALSRHVGATAIQLTETAQKLGAVRRATPAVSALGVVGASERLLHAALTGEVVLDPATAARDLVSLVLDGARVDA